MLALDLLAGYWLVTQPLSIKIITFGLHLIASGIAIYFISRLEMTNFEPEENFVLVGVMVCLVLPVYGLLGIYLTVFAIQLIRVNRSDYFEPDELAIPAHPREFILERQRDLMEIKRDELDIQAFRDILKSNDRQLEEITINKLSRILNREAIALLKEVVLQATSDTKILAANALIDVEDNIVHKINDLRSALSKRPVNPELILDLARIYDLYCYLGVLDGPIAKYYRNLAMEQYKTFLVLRPKHAEATFEYGRILLHAGHTDEATKYLLKAIDYAPNNASPYIWLAEASYLKRDFPSVTELCNRVTHFRDLPYGFKPVTELWTSEAPAAVK